MDATWRELPRDNLVIVNEKKKKKKELGLILVCAFTCIVGSRPVFRMWPESLFTPTRYQAI